MSSDDGRHADHVRGRLDTAIAEIPAPPAPVAAVVRKGKLMRVRRRAVAVAVVALAAAAAVVTPGIVHELSRPAPAAKPPRVTVNTLGRRAVNGVIASGTIGGKRWQIRLIKKGGRACWSRRGSVWAPNSRCVEPVGDALKHVASHTDPASIWTAFTPAIFGLAGPDVARVAMRLSDGVVLTLRPVEVFGQHWVGIVLPEGLTPAKVVAYSQRGEIAHSVPFVGGIGSIEFLSWLPPGDDGPTRMTKTVRGGGMIMSLHVGPWGNVLVGDGMEIPLSLTDHPSGALSGGGGLPRTVPMTFPWPAAYMRLAMSDGSTRTVRLVQGAGLGFAIVWAPKNPHIVRWDVYASDGRRLTGGVGSPGA